MVGLTTFLNFFLPFCSEVGNLLPSQKISYLCKKSPTFAKNLLPLQKISYLCKKSPTFAKNLLPLQKISYLYKKSPTFAKILLPLRKNSHTFTRSILPSHNSPTSLPIPNFPNVPILLGSELLYGQVVVGSKQHTLKDTHIWTQTHTFYLDVKISGMVPKIIS